MSFWKGIWTNGSGVIDFKNGLKLSYDSAGSLGLLYAITGQHIYGNDISDKVIVDVGANRGYFSAWAIKNGAKKLLAFEPVKTTFNQLENNIKRQGHINEVSIYNKAVASLTKSDNKIYYNEGLEDYSLHFADDTSKFELVDTVSLTDIVELVKEPIDILKLNCEGAEYDILLNSPDEVFDNINSIRLEYHNFESNDTNYHVSSLHERLEQLNYNTKLATVVASTHGIVIYTKS